MQLLTVGPVPPEWGGPRPGGVATFHRTLIEHLGCDVTTITNGTPPVRTLIPPDRGQEAWYANVAPRFDVVLMLHVAHRWAVYHSRSRPVPAVGAVRSWTPVLVDPGKHQRIQTALDSMDALVFPVHHAVEQGRRLGFTYRDEPAVIHHPLSELFFEPAEVQRSRSGAVFVGAGPTKRRWLAEQACRQLDIPLTVVENRPQGEVRKALLEAEVLCVPSSYEAFGNAYLEAAACGTPSVGYPSTITELSEAAGTRIGIGALAEAEVVLALEQSLSEHWDRKALRTGAHLFKPERTASEYRLLLKQQCR